MPNLVIKGVVETIQRSDAIKIYVCNAMTQPGETDGYAVTDHVNAILGPRKDSIRLMSWLTTDPPQQKSCKNMSGKKLVSQLTRIRSLAEEGLSMLYEDTQHLMDVLNLAKDISSLSVETMQVADASKVQVLTIVSRKTLRLKGSVLLSGPHSGHGCY